jgi:hypothetical protein
MLRSSYGNEPEIKSYVFPYEHIYTVFQVCNVFSATRIAEPFLI